MHLLLHAPRFLPQLGGLQQVTHGWATALTEMGHQVTVLTTELRADPRYQFSYKVVRTKKASIQWQSMRKADAIIMMDISLKALPYALAAGRPLLVSHHSGLRPPGKPFPPRQKIKQWVCNHLVKANIACSAFIASDLKQAKLIPSPYNHEVFYNRAGSRDKFSLLFAGRLVTIKGLPILLEAMAAVPELPYRLVVAGEGPEKEAYRQLAEALGIGGRISWLGAVDPSALAGYMNKTELVVVPSLEEPFGTVVLEALACGCRVIASEVGGLPEALSGYGKLVPAGDAVALAGVLRQMPNLLPPSKEGMRDYLAGSTYGATAAQLERYVREFL